MANAGKMRSSTIRLFQGISRFLLVPAMLLLMPGAPAGAITLDDCIRAALKMNPGLEAAAHRVDAARAAHLQARAPWYPHLVASGDYTRTDNPAQAFMMKLNQERLDMADPGFDPTDPGSTQNMRLSLGARYLLFDWGRSRSNEQMAKQGIEMSSLSRSARRNELVYDVTRGYYNALKADAFTGVYRETAESIEKSLELARNRFSEGVVLKTDVLNLEVQHARAEEDLLQAENAYRLALAALNTSIGAEIVGPGQLTPPRDDPPPFAAEPNADETIDNRPELQAAASLARTKRLETSHARRTNLPRVTAFGSLDMDSRVSDHFEESYTAGVKAEWALFDGFARSGAVSEAKAQRREAVARLKHTRKTLALDLKEAQLEASNAFHRLEVTRKALDSAAESLQMTREQYENGVVEITALLRAQAAKTDSSVRNRAAWYDYRIALANIDRAAGKQWED